MELLGQRADVFVWWELQNCPPSYTFFLAVPTASIQGQNACHSCNQSHSSDNARSLTCWATGDLFLFFISPQTPCPHLLLCIEDWGSWLPSPPYFFPAFHPSSLPLSKAHPPAWGGSPPPTSPRDPRDQARSTSSLNLPLVPASSSSAPPAPSPQLIKRFPCSPCQ